MAENILMEKTGGVPNVVWAGAAVLAAIVISRFLGGGKSAPAPTTTDTGGGTGGSPGPTGTGPCPTITPVTCGPGYQLVYNTDPTTGCATPSCQPTSGGGGGSSSKFITVCVDVPCGTTIQQIMQSYGLNYLQFLSLNAWAAAYNQNLPGNIDHQQVRVA